MPLLSLSGIKDIAKSFFGPRAEEEGPPMNPAPPSPPPEPGWRVIKVSVTGASHTRADVRNQDAVESNRPEPPDFLPIVVAVADGHGGTRYFRSHAGARMAVEVATRYIEEFVKGDYGPNDKDDAKFREFSLIKRAAEESVPQKLLNEWAEKIREDLQKYDFRGGETAKLSPKDRDAFFKEMDRYQSLPKARDDEQPPEDEAEREKWLRDAEMRQECETKLFQAYGATLLAAAVTKDYVLYWQLGDGDILNVSSDGQVESVMIKDERLIANETTSLCTPNARREFRVEFKPLPEDPRAQPALIMLSTDGYSNSYSSRQGFEKVASDLLEMMCESDDGFRNVESSLPAWLRETSQGGSGDDITVGLILRQSAIEEVREAKRRRDEEEERQRLEAAEQQAEAERLEAERREAERREAEAAASSAAAATEAAGGEGEGEAQGGREQESSGTPPAGGQTGSRHDIE